MPRKLKMYGPMTMREAISTILNEIREYVLQSGIQEKTYTNYSLALDKHSNEQLLIIYEWLISLKSIEYKALKKTYEELPHYVWEAYKNLEEHDMPEVIRLNERYNSLRRKWSQRPKFHEQKKKKAHTNRSEKIS